MLFSIFASPPPLAAIHRQQRKRQLNTTEKQGQTTQPLDTLPLLPSVPAAAGAALQYPILSIKFPPSSSTHALQGAACVHMHCIEKQAAHGVQCDRPYPLPILSTSISASPPYTPSSPYLSKCQAPLLHLRKSLPFLPEAPAPPMTNLLPTQAQAPPFSPHLAGRRRSSLPSACKSSSSHGRTKAL